MHFKHKLNDYFINIDFETEGFSWIPYHECIQSSPHSDWMTFREDWYFLFNFRIVFGKGSYNTKRAEIKRDELNKEISEKKILERIAIFNHTVDEMNKRLSGNSNDQK